MNTLLHERLQTPASTHPRRRVLLLGPQTKDPNLARVLDEAGVQGRIATVTAGWQEREDEIQDLQSHLDGRSVNLQLYRRAEEVFQNDPEYRRLHRERQRKLRRAQRLYDVRLGHAMAAAKDLEERPDDDLLEQARQDAMEAVRRLDAEHLVRIDAIHAEFQDAFAVDRRADLAQHRADIERILSECGAVAIAGGHVAVLLNRLELFSLLDLVGDRDLVAWSAGAMVLSERVVLYHDSPPQGAGNAEVLERGVGAFRGIVPLPHANARLRLDDAGRVARFAQRFHPDRCCAFDRGTHAILEADGWRPSENLRRLTAQGAVVAAGEDGS